MWEEITERHGTPLAKYSYDWLEASLSQIITFVDIISRNSTVSSLNILDKVCR